MNSNNLINLLVGWSAGYTYSQAKNQEDEVTQGKNYYLSSLHVVTQLSQLGVVISTLNNHLPVYPLKNVVQVLCNIGPLLSFPGSLICAAAKQGEYENVAEKYNQSSYAYIPLPEKLNGRTVAVFSFFAEHSGNLTRVAIIAASIGLIVLGQTAYGGAVLTAVAYEAIDHMGFVPRRISLFMERYMPTVSLIGMCIGGTMLVRVFSAMLLSTHIIPSITFYLHQRIDAFVRLFFNVGGPTLKEIDAPLVKRENMTYDEMNAILESDSSQFKVNPAHCNKSTINLDEFPIDHDFDKYLLLFDGIDWESKYNLIRNKLKDDERFIDVLLKRHPEISKEDLANDVDVYIKELADEEDMSPEEYAANWVRKQMVALISMLKGEERVKGLQQDLDESIDICALLLPYLSSLQNPVELEDALLKIAVEGGAYCARGIKGAAIELISGILQNGIQQEEEEVNDDEIGGLKENYEIKMLQALQNHRMGMIQSCYQTIVQMLSIPQAAAKDKHGFDVYRFYLSLGVFPLTKYERNRVNLTQILIWEMYATFREEFYNRYQDGLNGIFKTVGEVHFATYIRQVINEDELLSKDEREQLLEKFTERNNDEWSEEETMENFHRLFLVRMGILIPK